MVFNENQTRPLSARERIVREELVKGNKDYAIRCLRGLGNNANGPTQRFLPLLKAWWYKVQYKDEEWEEVEQCAPAGAGEEYYLPRFHRSALQGVVDVMEVVSGYWNDEPGWDGWTKPTQSSSDGLTRL